MKISTLFVPGNSAHVRAQLPVAEELEQRGHAVSFLIRDSVIRGAYRVGDLLKCQPFPVYSYDGFYRSDLWRSFPSPTHFLRSKRELYRTLDSLTFDVTVSCNDTSALFDRLIVAYARKTNRESLLIQESIRPAPRRLHTGLRELWQQRATLLGRTYQDLVAFTLFPEFARRDYGHSDCSMIATAGRRFRQQLIDSGVTPEKIRVTGQPRLENTIKKPAEPARSESASPTRVILFCSQPLECGQSGVDRFFVDLVRVCDSLEDVQLVAKLHPRDLPPEHWKGLLSSGDGASLRDITATRSLHSCFDEADAMVTIASTTSVEAMAAGLPVGLINYLPTRWCLPYDEMDAAISVSSAGQLRPAISTLLFDTALRERLLKNAPRVLFDELYRCDGRSASRIADLIESKIQSVTIGTSVDPVQSDHVQSGNDGSVGYDLASRDRILIGRPE